MQAAYVRSGSRVGAATRRRRRWRPWRGGSCGGRRCACARRPCSRPCRAPCWPREPARVRAPARRPRRWRPGPSSARSSASMRTALLRSRRTSFCLFRLICDLMFAISADQRTSRPGDSDHGSRAPRPGARTMGGAVSTDTSRIRNFCIVAHIDHGKSTLADRLLEVTHTVADRDMRAQYLDKMDLERERGITIKAQSVRLLHEGYELNLIDTPGHVDFTYEVSRSLEACEGAVLLVDAAQGLEAQTLANYHLARDAGLVIVPALNKIDLPAAEPEQRTKELADLLDCDPDDILHISAKSGRGRRRAARARSIERVPPPVGDPTKPLQALIFDSMFDAYRGVITYVRVQEGVLPSRARIRMFATRRRERGRGDRRERARADPGARASVRARSAISSPASRTCTRPRSATRSRSRASTAPREPLPGYREPKPMVWSGLFPADGSDYADLRDALDRLKLSDAALHFEPETSQALGFGFRCGFLGLLAHGHREGAPRARVRPGAHRDRAERGVPRVPRRRDDDRAQPGRDAARRRLRPGRGAGRLRDDHHAVGLPRRRDGPMPGTPRRAGRHELPHARARRGALRAADGRDRVRLLRPAEVGHARLREPRLRAVGQPGGRPRARRRAAARRARRRVQHDRAPRRRPTPTASR